MNSGDKNIIRSLQGLRGVAFLLIFLNHSKLYDFACFGSLGVSIFLILSGFLMSYNYNNKNLENVNYISFSWKKLKKLYPLHLFVMIVAIIYRLFSYYFFSNGSISFILIKTALDTFLAQAWIPNVKWVGGLNGPSWFLCVSFFCYLIFPFIKKLLEKIETKRQTIYAIITLIFLETFVAIIGFLCGDFDSNGWFSTQWITYYCPLSRFIDFCVGCLFGHYFVKFQLTDLEQKKNLLFNNLIELFVLFLVVFCVLICSFRLLPEAFTNSLIFVLPCGLLIYILCLGKGFISKLLSFSFVVFLGNISPYAFLIHYWVIKISYMFFERVFPIQISNILVVCFAFTFTIIASIIWIKISGKFLNKKEIKRR